MATANNMTGRTALITGAAGGLGRATALKLGAAGANVSLVDVDEAEVAETARQLEAQGTQAHVNLVNISTADACATAVSAAVARFGRLDVLCNVATAFFPSAAERIVPADWQEMLDLNLSGPLYLMQAAIPHLLQNSGAIVNVTSCAAFMAKPYTGPYGATKAALTHLTRAFAAEYIDQPIRINAIAPGSMDVGIGSKLKIPADIDMAQVQRLSPARGLIPANEVADMIVFLASDAARGIHGASISIDNGISLS